MKLFKELDISLEKSELISIVGGGGKTTSMFRLARELLKHGKKVLVSTTTAIFKPEDDTYESLYLTENTDYKSIRGSTSGITVIGSRVDSVKNKLMGVDDQVIDEIFRSKIFDYIIIEADGANRKPIKAPASHEPVIPSMTTKVIGLIGMDCVGKKIYEENVHRADIFAQVTSSKLGDIIDENTIYNLALAKDGIFKSTPLQSKKYIILNKVESKERQRVSEKVKSKVFSTNTDIENIIIGSMRKEACVTGLIMASGFSRRMKTDKLLLELGGKTVLERVIDSCLDSNLDDIILIYRKEEVRDIAIKNGIKAIHNENADRGQSESIKIGVKNVGDNSNGIMFIVGDQPHLDSKTIDILIDEFEKDQEKIIIPIYDGNKGNPTIFPASLKNQFSELEGDVGGKEIISKNLDRVNYIDIDNHKAGIDMDTVEEYEKLKEDF